MSLAPISDPRRLFRVLGQQGIAQGEVECSLVSGVARLHQIKQASNMLGPTSEPSLAKMPEPMSGNRNMGANEMKIELELESNNGTNRLPVGVCPVKNKIYCGNRS